MSKKTKKKKKIPAVNRVFYLLSCILVFVTILLVSMHSLLTERGISRLAQAYIGDVSIPDSYYDRYINEGMTEEECNTLLNDRKLKQLAADVMGDKLASLFNQKEKYQYTKDNCISIASGIIKEIHPSLDPDKIKDLAIYTLDISGVSAMLVWDTPAAYRTSIYEGYDASYYHTQHILQGVASVTAFPVIVSFSLFTVICLVLLAVFQNNEGKVYYLSLAICHPSAVFAAICAGELIGFTQVSEVQNLIFRRGAAISSGVLFLGIFLFILEFKLRNAKEDENNG